MINVGIVGIGFMGLTHYTAYAKVRGAKVLAICTRDPKKLAGDWRGIQGNLGGPAGGIMDLKGIQGYADWQDLVRDPRIDLVDICLPPAMHAQVARAALKANKHVLCEKPIALTSRDASKMVAAASTAGRRLLIAQVLPFFPEYAFASQVIRAKKYGRLLGAHFKRVISNPLWIKDFFDPTGAGGPVIDLHIHDAHFLRLLCGMPRAVFSTGRRHGDAVKFVNTQFLFDDQELSVTASSGVIDQQARSFTHGFEIYLERATLIYDFSVIEGKPLASMPLTILTADGKSKQPDLPPVDAFVAELLAATKAIQSGQPSPLLDGELARDALILCERQMASVRKGRPIRV